MVRSLALDLFDVLLPFLASVVAFLGGCVLERLPTYFFRTIIGVAVSTVLFFGVSYFTPIHAMVSDSFWHIGGVTTVACFVAMLLLGVVWTSRGRSTSTGFLRVIVGLVFLIVLLNSGGRLWWRFVNTTAWQNLPDATGCLKQSSGWTCSPAVAAMLLHHYAIETSEGEMAYLAGTNYLGTDAPSIAHAIMAKAAPTLAAHIADNSYEACIHRADPFLACVHVPGLGGHAVLVLEVHPDNVELIDPRFGYRQRIHRIEFEQQWQGKMVFLTAEN